MGASCGMQNLLHAALLLASAISVAAGNRTRETLPVLLYPGGALTDLELEAAGRETAALFRVANVDVHFTICRGEACADQPAEISVRFVSGSAPSNSPGRLGATLHTGTQARLCTVYVGAVRDRAGVRGVRVDILLGNVIAHEIGHLFLGPDHSAAGVMSAHWSEDEYQLMSRGVLYFTREQRDTLRKAVALSTVR